MPFRGHHRIVDRRRHHRMDDDVYYNSFSQDIADGVNNAMYNTALYIDSMTEEESIEMFVDALVDLFPKVSSQEKKKNKVCVYMSRDASSNAAQEPCFICLEECTTKSMCCLKHVHRECLKEWHSRSHADLQCPRRCGKSPYSTRKHT